MTNDIRLTPQEATSAEAIQRAIDALGEAGGRVILPAMDLTLDRGIELRSHVALVGQGRDTVLRKAPGRIYPLSGYHNYGMMDVPLMHTGGLKPGMTVAIRDEKHGGFFETFARITWVDETWVGIDQGLHSDYHAELNPILVTAFPLIYGLEVEDVSVEGLTLDGNREAQPAGIGACRGAAVYFLKSRSIAVSDVVEFDFAGEGLGYQMCSDVDIRDCHFAGNAGNGYHPGAGSTVASFENCVAERNGAAGFFFCVRANHITVQDCTFRGNDGPGISVGTRDSHNLMERCTVEGNGAPGILFRETRRPVAMHSCRVNRCRIHGNARNSGAGQVAVLGDAHDIVLTGNDIGGVAARETAGIYVAPTATTIWERDNRFDDCFPPLVGDRTSLATSEPEIECGRESGRPEHLRHLNRQEVV